MDPSHWDGSTTEDVTVECVGSSASEEGFDEGSGARGGPVAADLREGCASRN